MYKRQYYPFLGLMHAHTHTDMHARTHARSAQSSPSLCLLSLCSACLSNVTFQGDTLLLSPQRTFPPTQAERQTSCFAVYHNGTMPSFSQPASLRRRMHVHARSEQKYYLFPHGNPSVTVTNVLSVCLRWEY